MTCPAWIAILQRFAIFTFVVATFHHQAVFGQDTSQTQPEFDPANLKNVQDDVLGIPSAEQKAYYGLLAKARNQNVIKEAQTFWQERKQKHPEFASSTHPPFADLFKNPDDYRGKPVSQIGHLRRLIEYDAGENEFGITKLYEGWIYPADSDANPIVVVCPDLSSKILRGDNLSQYVGVSGYYFKLYGYKAQDTTRRAPMLLADDIVLLPPRTDDELIKKRMLFFAICAILFLPVFLFVIYTGLKRKDNTLRSALPEELPEIPDQANKPAQPPAEDNEETSAS